MNGFDKWGGVLDPELRPHGLGHTAKRHHAIADRAQRGRQRRVVADAAIDHCRQRIQIAPRAGLQFAVRVGVLLDGRVIHLEHGGVLVVLVANGEAGRAQIEQHRRSAVLQKNVVGRNVAVQGLAVVQHTQRAAHRPDHLAQPCLGGRRAHLRPGLLEGSAGVERHHHVGRVIRLPEAEHLDQRRMVELRQQTGFVHKRGQSGLKRLFVRG